MEQSLQTKASFSIIHRDDELTTYEIKYVDEEDQCKLLTYESIYN